MNTDLLFVYGTLRRASPSEMNEVLRQNAEFLSTGCFQGILYQVDGYPGAVPSADRNDRVVGELYRLRQPSEILARLDAYEECGPEFPPPTEFVRRQAMITTNSGREIEAWIYLYNRPTAGLCRIESGDFLEHLSP